MLICMRCGRENEPGATFCSNRECGAVLEWEGKRVQPDSGPPTVAQQSAPPAEPERQSSAPAAGRSVAIGTALNPTVVDVEPGGEARCRLHIRNQGNIADRYGVEILGEPVASWSRSEPATLALDPGSDDAVVIRFAPPRGPDAAAGTVPFRVRVTSTQDPSITAVEGGTVTVAPFTELSSELVPATTDGRRSGKYQLTTTSRGNRPERLALDIHGPGERLNGTVDPATMVCEPGTTQTAAVDIRAKQRLWTGSPRPYPFTVSASREDDPAPAFQQQGTFVQKATLTPLVILAVTAPVVLAVLGVLAWLFVLDRDVEVPAVLGMTPAAAERFLANDDLELGDEVLQQAEEPEGTVIAQDPEAGEQVEPGTPVSVTVAEPIPPAVPDIVGQTPDEAAQTLLREGLIPGELEEEQSEEPEGTVIAQDPGPEEEVEPGTEVSITVAVPPVPEDERCTDEIRSNERWACLASATFDGEQLVIDYEAEWAGSDPDRSGGFHLHLYGSDGVNPPAEIMGTHAPQPRGPWVIDDRTSPLTYPIGDSRDELLQLVSGQPKVCVRIANSAHELVPDNSGAGTFTTGNCVPIER